MMRCFNFLNNWGRSRRPCFRPRSLSTLVWLLTAVAATNVLGQGMPPEARENIHVLLNNHSQVHRELLLTEKGYEAVTESTNQIVASALQRHVEQMKERLDAGMAARRWDPAFAEYRAHYTDIDISIEPTEHGVKIVGRGATPEAVKVAQNHAKVINAFVESGWDAHGELHPAVLKTTDSETGRDRRGRGNGWRRGQQQSGCPSACNSENCPRSEKAETDMKGTKS